MKSRFPLLIAAAAAAAVALALPGAANAATAPTPYYPYGPQQNVSRADVAASGWTVCYTSTFDQDWQDFGTIDNACNTGEYVMLATGVASDPGNWALLAAAPRSAVMTTVDSYNVAANRNLTINANGSEWHRGDYTSWGFAPAGDTVDHVWEDCDLGTAHPELRMCWNAWANTLTFGGRVGTTFVPMSGPMGSDYTRAVLQFTPNVHATGAPLTFPSQPLSTVSAKQTVAFSVSGGPGLTAEERALGKLKVTGADADEFDIIDNDCPTAAPDSQSVNCTVKVRFVPQASGARSATLGFANALDNVTLTGTGGQLPQGPAGNDGNDGNDGVDGNDGANGTDGANGNDGQGGATGPQGLAGKDGTNGRDGAKGDKGDKGVAVKFAKRGKTRVGCTVTARGAGSRIVCQLNRRSGRNWLMQLRDRRGALSTAAGNGKTTMVFLSARQPRGTMHAFVIKGLPTS